MAYDLRKERFGVFAYFVEEGTVVDENTVGIDFFPDATTDPEAWNSLGCVLQSNMAPETEDSEPDDCPNPAGGYTRESTTYVLRDIYEFQLKAHSEPIHRLIWGVSTPFVDGTPATPFASKDRKVRGWLNLQLRAEDGTDRIISAIYGDMRLAENPVWSKDPTKPSMRFEIIDSPIASVESANIVA